MEIVINRIYGGFGLSPMAVQRYLKLKGKEVYFYELDYLTGVYKKPNKFNLSSSLRYFTKDFGEKFNYQNISEDEFKEYHFYERNIDRTDKDLIKVVRELGEKANGIYSNLKIIEIPDNIEYTIEEYDGVEWVAEKHETWE